MSSSIEENFQPPEWANREEVIKAAQHYINYWKIEARQRNGQWLQALAENARLKAENKRLRASSFVTAVPVEEYEKLKAEVARLEKENEMYYRDSMSDEYDLNHQIRIINGLLGDKEKLQAENERLRKAGDAMAFIMAYEKDEEFDGFVKAWNAAKDGKPTA
jgi:hypothetical protein